jgi:prepilin-type N-terminal cleavage/methylation domain-containing protein
MSPRRTSGRRGYTIAEVLLVTVIMGMISSFVVLIVAPLFKMSNAQTAKVDTVQAAAKAFYRVQRDLRQSDVSGVYVCTYPAPSTCSPPASALTHAAVVAIITPLSNGYGQLTWDSSQGQPKWQGFSVYWLAPDAQGLTALNYAFADPTGGANPTTASADAAVNKALGGAPSFLATSIADLQLSKSTTTSTIGLKMFAQSTEGGATNATSFESDTDIRN